MQVTQLTANQERHRDHLRIF